jgi:hypothetical protein
MDKLPECHVIIVCVHSDDSEELGKHLVQVLHQNTQIPIFSLQKGVKNGTKIKDMYVQ